MDICPLEHVSTKKPPGFIKSQKLFSKLEMAMDGLKESPYYGINILTNLWKTFDLQVLCQKLYMFQYRYENNTKTLLISDTI